MRTRQQGQGETVTARNYLTYKAGHLVAGSGATSNRIRVGVGAGQGSAGRLRLHSLFSMSLTRRAKSPLSRSLVVECARRPVARSLAGLSAESALGAYAGVDEAVCVPAGPQDEFMSDVEQVHRLISVDLVKNNRRAGLDAAASLQQQSEAQVRAMEADLGQVKVWGAAENKRAVAGQEMLARAAELGLRAAEVLLIDSISAAAAKIDAAVKVVATQRDKLSKGPFKDLCTYLDPIVNKVQAFTVQLQTTCSSIAAKKQQVMGLYQGLKSLSLQLASDPKANVPEAAARSAAAKALAAGLYADTNALIALVTGAPGSVLQTIKDQWALLKSKGVNLFQFTFRKKWGSCKWAWAEAAGGMTVRLPGAKDKVSADQVLMPMLDFHADLELKSKHGSINLASVLVKAQVSRTEFSVSPTIAILGGKVETKMGMSISDFNALLGKGFEGLANAVPCFTATATEVTNSLKRAAQSLLKNPEARAWLDRQTANIAALAQRLQGMVTGIRDSVASFTQWLSTTYIPEFISSRVSAALTSAVASLIKAPEAMSDDLARIVLKVKDYIFMLSNDLSPANFKSDVDIDTFMSTELDSIINGASQVSFHCSIAQLCYFFKFLLRVLPFFSFCFWSLFYFIPPYLSLPPPVI